MLTKISPYRSALLLTSVIAFLEALFVGVLYYRGLPADELSLSRTAIAVAIVIGLWLVSNIARWLGAAWYAAIVVMVVYEAAINEHIDNKFSTYWVFALGLLCIAAVCLLLLSQGFREEWAALRASRPRWKLMIGRTATAVLVAFVVAATAKEMLGKVTAPL